MNDKIVCVCSVGRCSGQHAMNERLRKEDGDDDVDTIDVMGIQIPEPTSRKRRIRKRRNSSKSEGVSTGFAAKYHLTGEVLGEGAYASVQKCKKITDGSEYAVKVIKKGLGSSKNKVFREVEIFRHSKGHPNIIQLKEFFEEEDYFYVVFEIVKGGPLLAHIQKRIHFTENEASIIIRDIATALKFLHSKGIAHRGKLSIRNQAI